MFGWVITMTRTTIDESSLDNEAPDTYDTVDNEKEKSQDELDNGNDNDYPTIEQE